MGFLSNASLAEMHRPCVCTVKHTHTCPGYYQRWSTAWGALQQCRRRVHASHVQRAGYHCAKEYAWAVTAIFAGEHRELQASLQQHPILQALSGSCRHRCAGTNLCRHDHGVVGALAAAFSSTHEAARNRAGIRRELKASLRQHLRVVIVGV